MSDGANTIAVIITILFIVKVIIITIICCKRCQNKNTDPLDNPGLQIVHTNTVSASNIQQNYLSAKPQTSSGKEWMALSSVTFQP
jgi:hypothetical protein